MASFAAGKVQATRQIGNIAICEKRLRAVAREAGQEKGRMRARQRRIVFLQEIRLSTIPSETIGLAVLIAE